MAVSRAGPAAVRSSTETPGSAPPVSSRTVPDDRLSERVRRRQTDGPPANDSHDTPATGQNPPPLRTVDDLERLLVYGWRLQSDVWQIVALRGCRRRRFRLKSQSDEARHDANRPGVVFRGEPGVRLTVASPSVVDDRGIDAAVIVASFFVSPSVFPLDESRRSWRRLR